MPDIEQISQEAHPQMPSSSSHFLRPKLPSDSDQGIENMKTQAASSSGSSWFNQAQQWSVGTINIRNEERPKSPGENRVAQLREDLDKSTVVVKTLMEQGNVAAVYSANHRRYPPRCHKGTRQSIRADILAWSANPKRLQRMRWYWGPPAVGKSAIAQSAAEELASVKRLGATYFFSGSGDVSDPDTMIPTLASQLAQNNERYKRLITEALGLYPFILSMNRKTQFQALIIDPFRIIAKEGTLLQPLVIVVDGLDECKDPKAQCELIDLIRAEVEDAKNIPLLWMIFSRPEWHLKFVVADSHYPIHCQQMVIPIDDDETRQDAKFMLDVGITEIRNRHGIPTSWPPQEYTDIIYNAVSGHLGFVSFIVRFVQGEIGDKNDETNEDGDDGPCERFSLCVKAVNGSSIGSGVPNPLRALDDLYHRILSKISSKDISTTKRILGMAIHYPGHQLCVQDQAGFLEISQDTFYRSLRQLHSVVDIPKTDDADKLSIRLYHASFSDYLKNPFRSGDFRLDEGAVHYDVAVQSLSWVGRVQSSELSQGFESQVNIQERRFAAEVVWDACCKVPDKRVSDLIHNLEQFDFECLQLLPDAHASFAEFIRWLYTRVSDDKARDFVAKLWRRYIRPVLRATQGKKLVRIVQKPPKHVAKKLDIKHEVLNPSEFCEIFPRDVQGVVRVPMTLHFVVGNATQAYVSLLIDQKLSQFVDIGGLFARAHDLFIKNPNFQQTMLVNNNFDSNESNRIVLQRLAVNGALQATFDSSLRWPPPRCHPETRRSMRADITAWYTDSRRQDRLLWLTGPPAVGKSAVAQTMAEILAEIGLLGATYFFSGLNNLDDPTTLIPTLVYQLAAENAHYKRLITEILFEDPRILDKSLAVQFMSLILNPFRIIAEEGTNQHSLVIVIDGLDECGGISAQLELIELIVKETGSNWNSPLLWMVSGRPEMHLKRFFQNLTTRRFPFKQVELLFDDESEADAGRVLDGGIEDIYDQYGLSRDDLWTESQRLFILKAASNHLGLVASILYFLRDEHNLGDPRERLDACISALRDSGVEAGAVGPLELLDQRYRQILSRVPSDTLPTTKRILGLCIWYHDHGLSTHDHGRFLNIPLDTYYHSLEHLFSVILVPMPTDAISSPLRLYHPSFANFLQDPMHSRQFCLREGDAHLDAAIQSLVWLNTCNLTDLSDRTTLFSSQIVWDACRKVPDELVPTLMVSLDQFDFRKLQNMRSLINHFSFALFIRWLYVQTPSERSLISLSNETAATAETFHLTYKSANWNHFCANFSSDTASKALPTTFHFLLGSEHRIHVSLAVERP
ncbi:hypothetical protein NP233_g8919 [Leucocoprinus birnbaumii]|uniref:Nephrocystin 3-like N-terminal domain-containing protein n=1 Tax=Leucocoprinus birnbaumii TaxID=56174 RepID=A0AAD5VQ06_9AGAR|nr:hypothetical protein NP233_g8919 [Leucocoprinus birnbaumii]